MEVVKGREGRPEEARGEATLALRGTGLGRWAGRRALSGKAAPRGRGLGHASKTPREAWVREGEQASGREAL